MTNDPNKVTSGKLSKQGNIKLSDLSERTGKTRQMLNWLFVQDRPAFEDLLISEMEKDLAIEIEAEIAAIRTAKQIRADKKLEFKEKIKAIRSIP